MFKYRTMISLKDSDATGVLYFAQQLDIAMRAFEAFLKEQGFSLGKIIETSDFLMPIVHIESDFHSPLFVADEVEVRLQVSRLGTSSFTLSHEIFDLTKNKRAGTASIVHVAVSKKTRQSIPLPEQLRELLQPLLLAEQAPAGAACPQ